jgi:carboxyl-terminal processing protease
MALIMKHTKIQLITCCISLFISNLVFAAASASAPNQPAATTTISPTGTAKTEQIPLTELERFTTVLEHVKNYYVKDVGDDELFENSIHGMLTGLDPHSAYLDKEEFAELKASTSGKFGGLGIEVTVDDGFIKVISPIDGTPAAKGGLKAGDIIVRIDDAPVKDMPLKDAVDKMRGKPGTEVSLTIVRQGETKPLKIKLTREIINVQSVTSKIIDKDYGYIRISQFQNETGPDLVKQLKELLKKSNGHLKGIVLDLRNNPGGVLDASVQVASAFLDKDKIGYEKMVVYTKGRLAGSQVKEKATGKDLTNGIPIVIMVNGGSASAAEIVAGAMQDHRRAVILGTQTFGKASVQTVLPLKDQRGLKLTTALYYTPSGKSIQAKGITPDIIVDEVEIPKPNNSATDTLLLHEADLDRHLESKQGDEANSTQKAENSKGKNANGNNPQTDATASEKSAKNKDNPSMYDDYQLYQALNVLKAQQALQR